MTQVILFFSVFILIFLFYFIFVICRKKSLNKWKKGRELTYLRLIYHIDYDRINIKSLAYLIGFSNAFIMALVVTIISFFKGFIIQMLIGLLILIPLIVGVYHIIGKYYQKKLRRVK